jgi:hypothetical protein
MDVLRKLNKLFSLDKPKNDVPDKRTQALPAVNYPIPVVDRDSLEASFYDEPFRRPSFPYLKYWER